MLLLVAENKSTIVEHEMLVDFCSTREVWLRVLAYYIRVYQPTTHVSKDSILTTSITAS